MKELAEAIRRAQSDDEGAFAELVQLTLDGAYRFARSLGALPEDAEDAIQEAYVRVWRSLSRFEVTKPFTPWLYQIVKRSLFDLYRKNRTGTVLFEDVHDIETRMLPDPQPLPDALFEQERYRMQVRAAIADLPARDQAVLSLRYDEDFSFEDIAMTLEIPAATARSIHHRALAKLRERLADFL